MLVNIVKLAFKVCLNSKYRPVGLLCNLHVLLKQEVESVSINYYTNTL